MKIRQNSKKRITVFKVGAAVLFLAFCFLGLDSDRATSTYGASNSYQGQIDEAKENKEKLEKEKKELEKKLAELKVEKNNLQKAIEQLDKEYTELYESVEKTELDIKNAEEELLTIEDELARMEKVAAEQYEAMKSRIKYMYENGETSLFSLFLSGGSIEKIFNEMEYRSQITKYDKLLLQRYNDTIAQIEGAKELQIVKLEELEAMKAVQEAELAGMDTLTAEKKAQMSAMAKELGVEEEEIAAFSKDIAATESKIQELVLLEKERLEEEERKRKEAESRDIKNILWPLEGCKRITSNFGSRPAPLAGASTYHHGVDIGAPMGTDVHAVLAGTVIGAGYNNSAGNYVIVDHGNGFVSHYYHASKILVQKGDEVKRDQVIMKVGSTGMSTGPHLHLTFVIDGTYVDPLKYVSYNR